MNTYVMGIQLEMFFILTVQGLTLDVQIWRLQTSDSDD